MAAHDPPGFQEYIAARRDHLVRIGVLLTGDRHHAEDLVQAALVRVWPKWTRVSRGDNVDAYVRRVLTSTFLNWRRRLWHREHPTDLGADAGLLARPAAGDPFAAVDTSDVLIAALRGLPPRQRAVVVLRFYADLSEADCADALGCGVGTIKSQTHKALKTLRALPALRDAATSHGRVEA
ncbi:SigE family RNA polymerase sigma factor [Yinghuangia seranimata]|uniref:SigE family RNA polymerase sigma factor n=1 Tax=Yinghuangia seranimata TaxID=408067 RepID=UPI00248B977C|nr:SigE family RNA polymerase sigma factor [Yinghuangia seranimata]MDI2127748.1 SigE family RNA polymerase sigma factor [Yinghuangia seranimata]